MPQIRPEVIKLGLFFLSVPFQLFLVEQWGSNEVSRTNALKELFSDAIGLYSKFFRLDVWHSWIRGLLSHIRLKRSPASLYPYDPSNPQGESPAVEVFRYKSRDGYFATAPEPRHPRSTKVKYRVGQVIIHKKFKYRGVIIGWDEGARAPEFWLRNMLGDYYHEYIKIPHYAILVHMKDRHQAEVTYVPEEYLEVTKNTEIKHPKVEDYFEAFDGAQYIPRPWLKGIYPND